MLYIIELTFRVLLLERHMGKIFKFMLRLSFIAYNLEPIIVRLSKLPWTIQICLYEWIDSFCSNAYCRL